MFRQISTVALVVMLAVGSVAVATAAEPKEAADKAKSPPKELTVDLGKGVKLEMVLIPAGEFIMGSQNEEREASGESPQHRVRMAKPFYLGKHLVTQEQWRVLMGNNPSDFEGPRNPVSQVSWDSCQAFLTMLNEKGLSPRGMSFRLPTEAQWEYACRAGSTTRYCFGDKESELGEYGWYSENSGGKPHPIGGKTANAWGLYDMHGNMCEWCADWYDAGYYSKSPKYDPTGAAIGSDRVVRGGHWNYGASECRSAGRLGYAPRIPFVGFRVALTPADEVPTAAEPTPAPTKQITNSIGMKLTLVPSGEFMMGSKESAEETAAFFNRDVFIPIPFVSVDQSPYRANTLSIGSTVVGVF